jgi:large-conductance mechanosensitive channel
MTDMLYLDVSIIVGTAVGATEGKAVGKAVSVIVGTAVGTTVGKAVEVTVGVIVGTAVGPTVGKAVGDTVGVIVGKAVGDTLVVAATVTLRTLCPKYSVTYTLPLLSTAMPVGQFRFAAVAETIISLL